MSVSYEIFIKKLIQLLALTKNFAYVCIINGKTEAKVPIYMPIVYMLINKQGNMNNEISFETALKTFSPIKWADILDNKEQFEKEASEIHEVDAVLFVPTDSLGFYGFIASTDETEEDIKRGLRECCQVEPNSEEEEEAVETALFTAVLIQLNK